MDLDKFETRYLLSFDEVDSSIGANGIYKLLTYNDFQFSTKTIDIDIIDVILGILHSEPFLARSK